MSTDLSFAIGRVPQRIRFVIVNDRIPRQEITAPYAVELLRKVTSEMHRTV